MYAFLEALGHKRISVEDSAKPLEELFEIKREEGEEAPALPILFRLRFNAPPAKRKTEAPKPTKAEKPKHKGGHPKKSKKSAQPDVLKDNPFGILEQLKKG